jgi:hypothetical protein
MATQVFPRQRPWSREAAAALLDMSGGLAGFEAIGARQLDAAVALHRMLQQQGCAYLADEVGMGKTYVALAVVALFRHLEPDFRVLYLAPSQNVLRKWQARELPAFIRGNVRQPDMRVQGPAGLPLAPSVACPRVDEWVRSAVTAPSTPDVFLPLSALSFHLAGDASDWAQRVQALARLAGQTLNLGNTAKKHTFKLRAAEIVNQAIPFYDLVVIDEAHLLKSGAGTSASDRVKFLATALGAGDRGQRRFGAALLLSGTPFDRDLGQLARQFELFASPSVSPAPHERVLELAQRRRAQASWSEIQEGLKPYMVRRVQELAVGTQRLSRNQYRREWRQEAGISLAGKTDPHSLKQRLFTAVVQKRLIEHLDGENEGRFPMAMFSSWEAYAAPSKVAAAAVQEDAQAEEGPAGVDALDVGSDGKAGSESHALDGTLMENLVGAYREAFGKEPPHPKLENEAERLAREAFGEGHKQLVFVRRLKSVDDLYARLNQAYDDWLTGYLFSQGMPGTPQELRAARQAALRAKPHGTAPVQEANASPAPSADAEDHLPASGDTLFSWLFQGELDAHGQALVAKFGIPAPLQLRQRLRNPERIESLIGELDWRGYAIWRGFAGSKLPYAELAERASEIAGPAHHLGRYRRLQLAWAQMMGERARPSAAPCWHALQEHLSELVGAAGPGGRDRIRADQAETLLSVPTIGLALYRSGLGADLLRTWDTVWTPPAGDALQSLPAQLQELDLQREVMFALLRLDHPFIDLYLGWLPVHERSGDKAAAALVDRVVDVCARPAGRFGTGSILRHLSDAWEQVAKTNFADVLKGAERPERGRWRSHIQHQLLPFSPVEWASGNNTSNRSAIARRFRMPGYPMLLIATSVLQEGEDLHVCCSRVTHFGISGSPIGIEQKNGRVDRIGSLAQRRLQSQLPVEEAGIQVRFPHLSESLEWYQIRDLSHGINEYLRSMHELQSVAPSEEGSLAATVADRQPIPPLLQHRLRSPFEPQLAADESCVRVEEVAARFERARQVIAHANELVAQVAQRAGFERDKGRPDCYVNEARQARLALQPAHLTGELMILASRRLDDETPPVWLSAGRIDKTLIDAEDIQRLGADPTRKLGLVESDRGWELHAFASCFAQGDGELDEDEICDLLARIGLPGADARASVKDGQAVLLRVLKSAVQADRGAAIHWKPGQPATRQQWIRCNGQWMRLSVWEQWVLATRRVQSDVIQGGWSLLQRTLLRNAGSGPDFFLSRKGHIEARMVHPIAGLGAAELRCMLLDLAAVPVDEV